jgi:hypothetical protein
MVATEITVRKTASIESRAVSCQIAWKINKNQVEEGCVVICM